MPPNDVDNGLVRCVHLLRPVDGHERPRQVVVGHLRPHVWAASKVSAQTSVSPPQYHAGVHIFIDTIQHVIKAPGGIG